MKFHRQNFGVITERKLSGGDGYKRGERGGVERKFHVGKTYLI